MAPPNNPAVARVALIFSRDTRQEVNTFHITRAGGWDIGSLTTAANAVLGWYNSWYKINILASITLVTISLRVYDPANPLAVDLPVGVAGTASGTLLPADVTLSMSQRTGLAGRKFRGRMYHVGFANSNVTADDRTISAMTIAALNNTVNLIGNMLSNGTPLVVFHRATNTVTPVISAVQENILDSQRRRLPARGR